MNKVGTAIIGCGSVATFYCNTFPQHPVLKLIGVMDQNEKRAAAYSSYYAVRKYDSLEAVLNDPNVEMVINLTNPRSHFVVSKACLNAGKHVYSEKPLAMSFPEAQELVRLAKEKKLTIASAPSRVFAETAQTMWKALRENAVGKVHAVYAEMDGGLIYRSGYKEWINELGMAWAYQDEFSVGCTIEHAGYPVSWLTAFFGPAESVTAFATCQIKDLQTDVVIDVLPPDLTVACIKFKSGVVARLTSSWIAPADHSIRIIGDTGVLSTPDVWLHRSPVYITREKKIKIGPRRFGFSHKKKYPFAAPPGNRFPAKTIFRSPKAIARSVYARFLHIKKRVDFCIGPAELAASLREKRPCRLSPEYCLHNTEIVLAISNSLETGSHHKITTRFEPLAPMPWAMS